MDCSLRGGAEAIKRPNFIEFYEIHVSSPQPRRTHWTSSTWQEYLDDKGQTMKGAFSRVAIGLAIGAAS
jgi:hypothetical protein